MTKMKTPIQEDPLLGVEMRPGPDYRDGQRCGFHVWAPHASSVEVCLLSPNVRRETMEPKQNGYFQIELKPVVPGDRYLYRLDPVGGAGGPVDRPDPASRYQPEGVHGPSQVVTGRFEWHDANWSGLPLEDYIIYELHVGAFSGAGTFDAVIPRLDALCDLGVSALELMPVAQFPGTRNWGYDGVFPFAVQNTYGGPEGLKRLVDACHQNGMAVILDVVYNHLGPEGNYLRDFGPYFTDAYRTLWGDAVNFDGPLSDAVRRFFVASALYWVEEFHIDALRIDAVHAIFDFSARPFLELLARTVRRKARELNRRIYCIAESDLNDTRLVRPRVLGGFQIQAQWHDDFHHSLHTLLTGEEAGYYQDFGGIEHLAKAWREGFVYSGQYSVHRRRCHGNSSRSIPARRFVVFSQNHDQVGNRCRGERLSALVGFSELKLAAAVVLFSPFVPLLFMGEEYGETAPFPYFVSHSDPALIAAVREGRRREFAAFDWAIGPMDPQSAATFETARLHFEDLQVRQQSLRAFYREAIRLRRCLAPLRDLSKKRQIVTENRRLRLLTIRRWSGVREVCLMFHFSRRSAGMDRFPAEGRWHKRLDSAEVCWAGPGSTVPVIIDGGVPEPFTLTPWTAVLWERETRHPEPVAGGSFGRPG